jgi:protein-S-isoprenylcysteine O-methyltransferase Ste14
MLAHNLARYYDAAWITLGVVWLIGSFATKPVERIQTRSSRFTQAIVFVLAALLMVRAPLHFGALSRRFVAHSLVVGYIGLALTIVGLAIAIWARFYLGRNWSARVTIKKDHELVRTGPYAIVRHPIYSGIILALAGTVLGFGEIRALLGFVLVIVGIVLKSRLEEKFMSERFGEEYARYRREVKSLIPFVC